ncbi:MAG: ribonuclease III [Candidatus Beckwithbacteria bacterium]|nr:ribonuclease III [Candidatus Beckwithbacteria bacterium]
MIQFKNPFLLTTALTHRSAINEKQGSKISNERLEFLGDAVLELIVSDYLYHQYPHLPEGQLTSKRAQIVQTKTLAAAAKNQNLGSQLILSRGEKKAGGDKNPSLLANVFEALIGAIYLDQGLTAVKKFIQEQLINQFSHLSETLEIADFKSQLQEKWQKQFKIAPHYKLVKTSGPDHNRIFTVQVYCKQKLAGVGQGKSKQEAQQHAAKSAIISLCLNLN